MKASYTDRLLDEARRRCAEKLAVPPLFTDFCPWINVTLTAAQRAYCLVVYDGFQPEELDGEEREHAQQMFDGVLVVPPIMLRRVFTMAGGRAGKTYILGALRLVWGAFVRDLTTMAPGERAVALTIAPKDEQRQQVINYQLGAMRQRPELFASIIWPRDIGPDTTHEKFVVKRPDGEIVTFEASTCNRGGVGGRGRSFTDVLMDEAAFFQDANHVVNDKEIFKAAAPRVLPGGQAIAQTTAWAKAGYHYEQWLENFGHPISGIAAQATTERLRPAAKEIVELERASDPENARREFDAVPMGDTATTFFGEDTIQLCLDDGLTFPVPITPADPYHPESRAAGSDFAFRSNSAAQAIVEKIYKQITLVFLKETRPEPGRPLMPSVVAADFGADCRAWGVRQTMADGHYSETVREFLGSNVALYAAPASPSEVFIRARTLMRDGRVRIPNPSSLPEPQRSLIMRLLKQLRETKGRAVAGGGHSIDLPRWADGSHGDLVVGLCNALYQFGGEKVMAPAPEVGTAEWEAKERAKRRAASANGGRRLRAT